MLYNLKYLPEMYMAASSIYKRFEQRLGAGARRSAIHHHSFVDNVGGQVQSQFSRKSVRAARRGLPRLRHRANHSDAAKTRAISPAGI
jgi:hypothetical protein